MSAVFQGRGEILRRRSWLLAGALPFFALAVALTYFRAPPWAAFVELGLAFALVVAHSADAYRVRRQGSFRADGRGLWFNDALIVARRNIATAYLLAAERPIVHFVLRRSPISGPLDVELDDEDDARALLQATGYGIGQSVASFRAIYGSRWSAIAMAVLSGPALAWIAIPLIQQLGLIEGLLAAELLFAALLSIAVARVNTRVDVGSDGILLRRLGARRFVSFHMLEEASVQDRLILLTLRSGQRIRLDLLGSFSEAERSRDALTHRIEEARMAFGESEDTVNAEALVAPGGRMIETWLRDVRGLARARDYREARMDRERLWNVVWDASAPPATRAGAAVALASALDADSRARLRVASEACADPKLRVALARVADDADEEELVEALSWLIDDEDPARGPRG